MVGTFVHLVPVAAERRCGMGRRVPRRIHAPCGVARRRARRRRYDARAVVGLRDGAWVRRFGARVAPRRGTRGRPGLRERHAGRCRGGARAMARGCVDRSRVARTPGSADTAGRVGARVRAASRVRASMSPMDCSPTWARVRGQRVGAEIDVDLLPASDVLCAEFGGDVRRHLQIGGWRRLRVVLHRRSCARSGRNGGAQRRPCVTAVGADRAAHGGAGGRARTGEARSGCRGSRAGATSPDHFAAAITVDIALAFTTIVFGAALRQRLRLHRRVGHDSDACGQQREDPASHRQAPAMRRRSLDATASPSPTWPSGLDACHRGRSQRYRCDAPGAQGSARGHDACIDGAAIASPRASSSSVRHRRGPRSRACPPLRPWLSRAQRIRDGRARWRGIPPNCVAHCRRCRRVRRRVPATRAHPSARHRARRGFAVSIGRQASRRVRRRSRVSIVTGVGCDAAIAAGSPAGRST